MELTTAVVRLPAALDEASVGALATELAAAYRSSDAIVVLAGAEIDTFCTGLAIGSAADDAGATYAFADLLAEMHTAPKPLLASVNGRAIGGGMGLACACDWIVATDRATFALPELLWGLVPAIIWPIVTDRLPAHVARHWTMAAHARTAADAHAAGLVDELVPPHLLEARLGRRARALARLEPQAVRRLRQWARESRQYDLPSALARGAAMTAEHVRQPLVRRRWQAFTDGETPWSA